jgi:hypothetical protein
MRRVCGPRGVRRSSSHLASLLDPLIQRPQHARIHRRDHIDRRIEFFFRHARFPCVRKAPVHSWIAEPHHRDGEADQHLLALGETFDGMSIAVKSSKICFLQGLAPSVVLKMRFLGSRRS